MKKYFINLQIFLACDWWKHNMAQALGEKKKKNTKTFGSILQG